MKPGKRRRSISSGRRHIYGQKSFWSVSHNLPLEQLEEAWKPIESAKTFLRKFWVADEGCRQSPIWDGDHHFMRPSVKLSKHVSVAKGVQLKRHLQNGNKCVVPHNLSNIPFRLGTRQTWLSWSERFIDIEFECYDPQKNQRFLFYSGSVYRKLAEAASLL